MNLTLRTMKLRRKLKMRRLTLLTTLTWLMRHLLLQKQTQVGSLWRCIFTLLTFSQIGLDLRAAALRIILGSVCTWAKKVLLGVLKGTMEGFINFRFLNKSNITKSGPYLMLSPPPKMRYRWWAKCYRTLTSLLKWPDCSSKHIYFTFSYHTLS